MATNDHLPTATPATTRIGIAILRIVFGALMIVHGTQKIFAGPQNFIAGIVEMNIPLAELVGWLTILGEVGLGLALLLGLLTRIAGALAALMFFLIWLSTYAGEPLLTDAPGITAELLIFFTVTAVVLAFTGGGALALDRLLRKTPSARKARQPVEETQTLTV